MSRGSPRRYIQVSLLRDVSVLSLDARQVRILAREWADKSRLRRAWSDVEVLAARFLKCDPTNADTATDSWHHLLMAVGNFKRSAGLIVPAPLVDSPINDRPDRIVIPGAPAGESEVVRGRSATWRRLTGIAGLHVPTATTLLSALWPGYHVIIDWTDTDAAVGLDAAGLLVREGLDNAWLPRSTVMGYWTLYDWFRETVVATASSLARSGSPCVPLDVERALFQLDQRTKKSMNDRTHWTWSEYHAALVRQLAHI